MSILEIIEEQKIATAFSEWEGKRKAFENAVADMENARLKLEACALYGTCASAEEKAQVQAYADKCAYLQST